MVNGVEAPPPAPAGILSGHRASCRGTTPNTLL